MRSSKKRHALHPLLCSISPPQKENATDVISHNSYFVHVTLSFPYKYTSANAEEETQAVCKISLPATVPLETTSALACGTTSSLLIMFTMEQPLHEDNCTFISSFPLLKQHLCEHRFQRKNSRNVEPIENHRGDFAFKNLHYAMFIAYCHKFPNNDSVSEREREVLKYIIMFYCLVP